MEPRVGASAAFRHRDFRIYLSSRLFATIGEEMLGVAVGWDVYSIRHRAIDLGYVGLVQFVPALAFSLLAGSVADRVHRPRMVAVCNILLAACAVALLAFTAGPRPSIAPIFVVLFFAGIARAFEAPASQAIVPGLVPSAHFPNAVSWTSSVWQASTIAGPALGGAVYAAGGSGTWVYGVSGVALAIAAWLVLAIRRREAPNESAPVEETEWQRFFAGLRFVRARPVLLESVTLDLFAVLFGGATALLPVYASDILHAGPLSLGLLRGAPALGATAMAIALAHRPLNRRAGPKMLGCVALFGVATIVFGLSRNVSLSLASLVVLGASDMVSVVVRSAVVQLRTPDAMRGRVSAVSMMSVAASSQLGALESGLTAAWLGAVPAVVVGGIGTLVVVGIYAACFRGLRRVDRLDAPILPSECDPDRAALKLVP